MGTEGEGTLARQIERWLNEGGRDVDEATRNVLAQAHSPKGVDVTATQRRVAPPRAPGHADASRKQDR